MIERRFESGTAIALDAAELLRSVLPTPGNLMLSGGATPYAAYHLLAQAPCPVHPERRLFLSDERLVPGESERNNARNLAPMLDALGCGDRFIRVDTSLAPPEAAARFEAELQPLLRVDLGLLGMGSDGHAAGFFTIDEAARFAGPLVLHTARPDGLRGVSITPAFLKRVERIILLVAGEEKRAVLETLRRRPETIPAGIALAGHPNVELWSAP